MRDDVEKLVGGATEIIPPKANGSDPPPPARLDVDEVHDRHHDLTGAVDRLAELKGKVIAGEAPDVIFEAELHTVAAKYKARGMTAAKLRAAVEQRRRPPMSREDAAALLAQGGTQRDEILEIGLSSGELWHDADREAFATIKREQRRETWRVRSRDYQLFLVAEYRRRYGRVPAGQAMREGLDAIEAAAQDGPEHEALVRVAGSGGRSVEKIYIDLVDRDWNAVEVTAEGWRIVTNPEARFIRPRGLRALPRPQPGNGPAAIRKFQRLVNLHGGDFRLYVTWTAACLWPRGPYAALFLSGEQGTCKSTAIRFSRELTDPAKVKLSAPPRSEPDLAIAARNQQVVAYDNVSNIPEWLADAICRLATGGGLQKRMLYTDEDQNLIDVCRPFACTGIPDLISRGDLAERAIVSVLEPIPANQRRSMAELELAFEGAAPAILGALLDGLSLALRDHLRGAAAADDKSRMADFAAFGAATAPAFGWSGADFQKAYRTNRHQAVDRVLDADPIAEAIIEFARRAYSWGDNTWVGTMTGLLEEIGKLVAEETRREKSWPKDATRLSARLRRAAPALRSRGITMEFFRKRDEPSDGSPVRRMVKLRVEAI